MGFATYSTPYTFTDKWECAYIHFTFFVPETLREAEELNVIWFFHGREFVRFSPFPLVSSQTDGS
jgi:hypothetical protein